jgi:hypothetical protein
MGGLSSIHVVVESLITVTIQWLSSWTTLRACSDRPYSTSESEHAKSGNPYGYPSLPVFLHLLFKLLPFRIDLHDSGLMLLYSTQFIMSTYWSSLYCNTIS